MEFKDMPASMQRASQYALIGKGTGLWSAFHQPLEQGLQSGRFEGVNVSALGRDHAFGEIGPKGELIGTNRLSRGRGVNKGRPPMLFGQPAILLNPEKAKSLGLHETYQDIYVRGRPIPRVLGGGRSTHTRKSIYESFGRGIEGTPMLLPMEQPTGLRNAVTRYAQQRSNVVQKTARGVRTGALAGAGLGLGGLMVKGFTSGDMPLTKLADTPSFKAIPVVAAIGGYIGGVGNFKESRMAGIYGRDVHAITNALNRNSQLMERFRDHAMVKVDHRTGAIVPTGEIEADAILVNPSKLSPKQLEKFEHLVGRPRAEERARDVRRVLKKRRTEIRKRSTGKVRPR